MWAEPPPDEANQDVFPQRAAQGAGVLLRPEAQPGREGLELPRTQDRPPQESPAGTDAMLLHQEVAIFGLRRSERYLYHLYHL